MTHDHITSVHKTPLDLSQFDEPQLKRGVVSILQPHFIIKPEVTGKYLVTGERVRIDYLLYPLPHLIEQGFTDQWIGLEVKSPKSKHISGHDFLTQAITYGQSEFDGQRPAFVLMFPSVKHFYDKAVGHKFCEFLEYFNVGQLELGYYRETQHEWSIKYGSTFYYAVDRGIGPTAHALLKRRVGNC